MPLETPLELSPSTEDGPIVGPKRRRSSVINLHKTLSLNFPKKILRKFQWEVLLGIRLIILRNILWEFFNIFLRECLRAFLREYLWNLPKNPHTIPLKSPWTFVWVFPDTFSGNFFWNTTKNFVQDYLGNRSAIIFEGSSQKFSGNSSKASSRNCSENFSVYFPENSSGESYGFLPGVYLKIRLVFLDRVFHLRKDFGGKKIWKICKFFWEFHR